MLVPRAPHRDADKPGRCGLARTIIALLLASSTALAPAPIAWADELDEVPADMSASGEQQDSETGLEGDLTDEQLRMEAAGNDELDGTLTYEDEYSRSWADVVKRFNEAATSSSPVYIKIGYQFKRGANDPDLVLTGGEVVLDLRGFALDPRVGGNHVGSGRVITVRGGKLTIKGEQAWTNGGISGGNADVGGGILVEGGELCLKGCRIGDNKAERGGGVAVTGGSLTIEDALIERNNATYGGGVYVAPEGVFSQTGGTMTKNVADYGGGLYLEGADETETQLSGCTVKANQALVDGGGILAAGRVVRVGKDALVSANTASERGGNICVGDETAEGVSVVGIDGAVVAEGSAATGGGAAVVSGMLSLQDGSITKNRAPVGAGVAVLAGECRVLQGEIAGNAASLKGGGVAVIGGLLSLWGGSVTGNRAESVDDEWGETATAEGAGILVSPDGRLELRQSPLIRDNMRGDSAQDVFLEGESIIEVIDDFRAQGTIGVDVAEPPELDKTRPVATIAPYDEGVFVSQTPDCEMEFEPAGPSGGQAILRRVHVHEGTCVTSWADLSQRLRALASGEEASFWLSKDIVYGEGEPQAYGTRPLEVRRKARVTIDLNGYSINRGLSHLETPSDEDSERCLYVSNGSLTVSDSRTGGRILGGCCQRGGGIFVAEGSLLIEGGTITSNKATYGGGVYVGIGTLEVTGGSISGNVALAKGQPAGGGIYVGDNNALVEDTDNDGLAGIDRARFEMVGGTVCDNRSAGWGAGVCISNGLVTLTDGTIENNRRADGAPVGGGGLYACGASEVTLDGGTISGNELFGCEGAGVALTQGSKLNLAGGLITKNRATLAGAGVSVREGTATIVGGTIDDNFTYGSGGGLLVLEGATVELKGGAITNNRCRVDGAGIEVGFGGSLEMTGGEISGNLAWSGNEPTNTMESQADEDLGIEHFSSGGGIDVRGDATVSGGTIASNGAIIGSGICFNCERWNTERPALTLSGSPLFKDNYLSWAKYDRTDVSIFVGDSLDDSALIAIEGSFRPPRPLAIEKLYRDGWDKVALVGPGDYELGAFSSAQDVTRTAPSPYTLVLHDGILYAERVSQQQATTTPTADVTKPHNRTPRSFFPRQPASLPATSCRQVPYAPVPCVPVGPTRIVGTGGVWCGPDDPLLIPSPGPVFGPDYREQVVLPAILDRDTHGSGLLRNVCGYPRARTMAGTVPQAVYKTGAVHMGNSLAAARQSALSGRMQYLVGPTRSVYALPLPLRLWLCHGYARLFGRGASSLISALYAHPGYAGFLL